MASSRWKRFAFFDRKNLPLPPSVAKDLIPSDVSGSSGRLSNEAPYKLNLYPEESSDEAGRIGIGDYFSLSGCHATLPNELVGDGGGVERNSVGEGVAGMLAGWMARSSSTGDVSTYADKLTSASADERIDLQLIFASSRNTSLVHCIDVTARCTPNNPQLTTHMQNEYNAFHPGENDESANAEEQYNPEELDGWRGYYNPFCNGAVTKSSDVPPKPPTSSTTPIKKRSSAEQRILEEHLSTSIDSQSTSLFSSSPFYDSAVPKARIVAVTSSYSPVNQTLYVASITDTKDTTGIIVHTNPHLRLKTTLPPPQSMPLSSSIVGDHSTFYKPTNEFNFKNGSPRCVALKPGLVCVGTDTGVVLVYVFDCTHGNSSGSNMALVVEIPSPRSGDDSPSMYSVSSVEIVTPEGNESSVSSNNNNGIYRLFVSYRRRNIDTLVNNPEVSASTPTGGGVCCYDLGGLRIPGDNVSNVPSSTNVPVVSARYDMDGRDISTSCLCDGVSLPPSVFDEKESDKLHPRYAVARGDGLHLYSCAEKVGVCPIDGNKIGMCTLPPAPIAYLKRMPPRPVENEDDEQILRGNDNVTAGASYVLVATADTKANRDALDIYDTSNKLVGFHVLLSPGHRALRTVGMMSEPVVGNGELVRGGRTSAVVLTSGGSILTLTEKVTPDKVALLVQKQLYPAAISMAFSDPAFYRPEDITGLYRKYAEHLYRKNDFAAAMDQYILTIGSLESSHVIFRYLDAPKIPLVVKYLEALRDKGLASPVHDEMLRTCYLKLNDNESASKIVLTPSAVGDGMVAPHNPDVIEISTVPISRNLLACADDPSEMLAAICSLEAPEAVEALVAHGPMLARSLARETAGVVIALCDGTYSPTAMADAAAGRPSTNRDANLLCEKYPISLFANAFLENPRLFRLILSHCRKNDCVLTPMLRRTLLELTLDEWNSAKRTGDWELMKLRHDEAITMLSESQAEDLGDYEALVIVQSAGFRDGEILLYERLNMTHMLLDQYARSGNERARRNMLSMCEHDPELLAEVLAHFVRMAGEKLKQDGLKDEASEGSDTEVGGLLHDIHEALVLARDHSNSVPPVRVLRILAGEGFGQFSSVDTLSHHAHSRRSSIPLSVALDYVGITLDESSAKIQRLQNNVEEYNRLCQDMEMEIDALLSAGMSKKENEGSLRFLSTNVDIDEMYTNLSELDDETEAQSVVKRTHHGSNDAKETFWRELEKSDDPFQTMCFFLSTGYLDDI